MIESPPGAVAFVIPALNESATIASVVSSVLPYGRAWVVDDGSSDRTGELARAAGAVVLRHERPLGYDAAISDGIVGAADAAYRWAVTMDADGQHAADNLPRVIESLTSQVDIVVGRRARRARFSEKLMALAFMRRWGIEDPLCGLKAYRLDFFRARRLHGSTYASIGTEIMLQYLRCGARVAQIPIEIRPRADVPRFGGFFRANARILAALYLSLAHNWSRMP